MVSIERLQRNLIQESLKKNNSDIDNFSSPTLDLNQHVLIIRNQIINLERLPLIEKALAVLSQYSNGVSMKLFFEKVYSEEYIEENCYSRLNSLLWRVQRIYPEFIFFHKKRKKLYPNKSKIKIRENQTKSHIVSSKNKVVKTLEKFNLPFTVDQIALETKLPKRTVQYALSKLISFNMVEKIRKGRSFVYILKAN